MATRKIDPTERKVLVSFAFVAMPLGALAGALLANELEDAALTTAYWQQIMALTGVGALPLVVFFALVPRQWSAGGDAPPAWARWIPWVLLLSFAAAVAVILLCVYEIAVTPSTGAVPPQWLLYVTGVGAGATLGAVAAGLVATALDKVD